MNSLKSQPEPEEEKSIIIVGKPMSLEELQRKIKDLITSYLIFEVALKRKKEVDLTVLSLYVNGWLVRNIPDHKIRNMIMNHIVKKIIHENLEELIDEKILEKFFVELVCVERKGDHPILEERPMLPGDKNTSKNITITRFRFGPNFSERVEDVIWREEWRGVPLSLLP